MELEGVAASEWIEVVSGESPRSRVFGQEVPVPRDKKSTYNDETYRPYRKPTQVDE